MKVWVGKAIAAVGIIHSIFGFVIFRQTIAELFSEGLFNTVNGQPMREFAFWFILSGFFWILFGLLVDWCEREMKRLPHFIGWGFLSLTIIVLIIMPISGGWLMLIPAVGAILKANKSETEVF